MAISAQYLAYLEDVFAPLAHTIDDIRVRAMFGGAGVFYRGVMFALIANEVIYLKADAHTQAEFEAHACGPFMYARDGRAPVRMSYWQIPDTVLEDPDDMLRWARKAIDVAFAAQARKKKKSDREAMH